jgi:hypothetical protein
MIMRMVNILAAALGASCLLLPTAVLAQDDAAEPPCKIDYFASEDLLELIERSDRPFAFEGSQAFCLRLAEEGAGLVLDHNSGSLLERGYGWVSVAVIDLASEIGSYRRATTIAAADGLDPQALEALLLDSLKTAVTTVAAEPDLFIASMRDELAKVRQRLAPQ